MPWLPADLASKALSAAPSGDIKEMALAFSVFVSGVLGLVLRLVVVMDRSNKAQTKAFAEALEKQNQSFAEALERQREAQSEQAQTFSEALKEQNSAHIAKTETILGMIEQATQIRDEQIARGSQQMRTTLEKVAVVVDRATTVLNVFDPPPKANGK